MCIGLLGFLWTNSFVNNSWIECDEEFLVPEAEPSFLFHLRVLLALAAQVIHQAGFWDLIELFVTMNSIPYDVRNLILLFVGLGMVAMAGSINAGQGINESYEDECEEVEDGVDENRPLLNVQGADARGN